MRNFNNKNVIIGTFKHISTIYSHKLISECTYRTNHSLELNEINYVLDLILRCLNWNGTTKTLPTGGGGNTSYE